MSFADLDEFFDDSLRLPVGGKVYVIASVDAETGLWCQRMMISAADVATGGQLSEDDIEDLVLDDDQERDMYKRVLGPVYDQLIADGVSWERLKHVGTTAFMWAAGNKQNAEEFWVSGGDVAGEPLRPEPQDHKAPAKKASKGRPASRGGSTKRPTAAARRGEPS